jgi:hypothetical protein
MAYQERYTGNGMATSPAGLVGALGSGLPA